MHLRSPRNKPIQRKPGRSAAALHRRVVSALERRDDDVDTRRARDRIGLIVRANKPAEASLRCSQAAHRVVTGLLPRGEQQQRRDTKLDLDRRVASSIGSHGADRSQSHPYEALGRPGHDAGEQKRIPAATLELARSDRQTRRSNRAPCGGKSGHSNLEFRHPVGEDSRRSCELGLGSGAAGGAPGPGRGREDLPAGGRRPGPVDAKKDRRHGHGRTDPWSPYPLWLAERTAPIEPGSVPDPPVWCAIRSQGSHSSIREQSSLRDCHH